MALKDIFTPQASTVSEPSLHDQAAGAHALADYARHQFADMADDLEDAAEQQEDVALAAQDRADELIELRDDSIAWAVHNRQAAEKIRSLIS